MHDIDISRLVELEDRHWWFRERRAILRRELRGLPPRGRALDIGAAGGGNTRVLARHGYDALVVDYSEAAVAAAVQRGLNAMHADARDLPLQTGDFEVVTAFDVLEHIVEDHLAAEEIARVLKPGGTALIAVPCDMALWSAHDDAVGHVRRYTREELVGLIEKSGLVVDRVWSWNVLLRPVVALRRRNSEGNDLTELPWIVNKALAGVIMLERYLPVRSMRGVSLFLRAHKPA
ncbi:class I SAM-dependent methyltransferase [Planomonospora venezuelensis]|uniref:SAM-dependent methyltransferase n=1 Tax=Planomonospora venezuelensis TaxID=1999 RepID=A0A841D734_PLAVE|nr:class I SAM-dependent methyltransferase [Planomonospora venezuelensis]MBB5963965.1 SAM-dependent methyltransferase [Planomonospora venezuelensis]GIN03914.1 methyltransferase [Planomonospora venezuelensis]